MDMKQKRAFSLIEVMLAIILVSAVLVIAASSLARRQAPKKSEGVVYTYLSSNHTNSDNLCFLTNAYYNGSTFTESYTSTRNCSEYSFTVPENVDMVNLTLVAGGGGGGGATGGVLTNSTIVNTGNASSDRADILENLLELKIKLMTLKGASGTAGGTSSNNHTGGTGGASSPAIKDFVIPKKYYRPEKFPLIYNASTTVASSLSSNNSSSSYIKLNGKLGYYIKYASSAFSLGCYNTSGSETSDLSVCGLNSSSIIPSYPGLSGNTVTSANAYPNMIIDGGRGGKSPDLEVYGTGGNGGSIQISCVPLTSNGKCDTGSTVSSKVYKSESAGNYAYINYAAKTVVPGGAGGGGASGTFVRILNFPVTPGTTYKILVGKGGIGGKAGINAETSVNGGDGEGGVSTAIFQGSNLVFMVNGGGGGYHGQTNTTSAILNGRNPAKVIYKSTSPSLDTNLATSVTCATSTKPGISDTSVICLSYPTLNKEPYTTLNLSGIASNTNSNRYGGFSKFDTGSTLSYLTVGETKIYNGLYYRMIAQNSPAYIGGSGGFSGLGGKAACGAYFMGNAEGLNNEGAQLTASIRQSYTNKIALGGAWYNVFDYYEGCNASSVNGNSIAFVSPDPVTLNFGKAGYGGSGGGYHLDYGVGNGGDGTNGYLMIDWKR